MPTLMVPALRAFSSVPPGAVDTVEHAESATGAATTAKPATPALRRKSRRAQLLLIPRLLRTTRSDDDRT